MKILSLVGASRSHLIHPPASASSAFPHTGRYGGSPRWDEMSRGVDAQPSLPPLWAPPCWKVSGKTDPKPRPGEFPRLPCGDLAGRDGRWAAAIVGTRVVHSPTRCEVRGCTTLGEADVGTAEGNAHGCAAVVGPAWNLQSHQELLINNQLDKAV